jgi:hypothetical protein
VGSHRLAEGLRWTEGEHCSEGQPSELSQVPGEAAWVGRVIRAARTSGGHHMHRPTAVKCVDRAPVEGDSCKGSAWCEFGIRARSQRESRVPNW